MGCIQSGAPINIVRLTYRAGVPTARVLPSDEILELMRNPLLRSTGVLNGLFYEHVIVTESDTDRAFYEEVNERLLRYKPEWGMPNCLFLNSQGKHTLQTIIQPLRKLGIPAAGIVDVDVLKDRGAQWSGIMDGINMPQTSRQAVATLRTAIKAEIDATQLDMKRDGGIAVLKGDPREAAETQLLPLIFQCRRFADDPVAEPRRAAAAETEVSDLTNKKLLLEMAQTWVKLAELERAKKSNDNN